jgi:hypothetical protein
MEIDLLKQFTEWSFIQIRVRDNRGIFNHLNYDNFRASHRINDIVRDIMNCEIEIVVNGTTIITNATVLELAVEYSKKNLTFIDKSIPIADTIMEGNENA